MDDDTINGHRELYELLCLIDEVNASDVFADILREAEETLRIPEPTHQWNGTIH